MPNEEIYEGTEEATEVTEVTEAPENTETTEAPEAAPAKKTPKISRPKDATKPTGMVWEICDKHWGSPEFGKLVREDGKAAGLNAATVATQLSRYKKFMEQESDAAPEAAAE
ncbi:MAG: hypothetical protein AB7C95_00710 [Synergistaceae bacterium]